MNETAARPETRILVIEDNPDTRNLYKHVLEREGYEVILAEDGEKGWSCVQAAAPHLLMLDLNLPKMDGLEVLRNVRGRAASKDVPVIVFSSSDEPETVREARRRGADNILMKSSVSPRQMLAKIKSLLERNVPQASARERRFAVLAGKADLTPLQEELGAGEDWRCRQCRGGLALDLQPDPTRTGGHWFLARVLCSDCGEVN
jgi:DNA-binding response OmpR family regulator